MRPDDRVRILHMRDACLSVERFVHGRSRPDLDQEAVDIRNRLIHAYFDIDLDILWRTALDDLPALRKSLDALLSP